MGDMSDSEKSKGILSEMAATSALGAATSAVGAATSATSALPASKETQQAIEEILRQHREEMR
jgi:hypothetical protein